MSDRITKKQRSYNMSQIKGRDTKIEIEVRRFLYKSGYRYRKNVRGLPGTPDIVMKNRRIAIFVNGCYWHHHRNCKLAYTPKTNTNFWENKFVQNMKNDKKNDALLRKEGYKVITLWECKLKRQFDKEMYKTVKTIERNSL